MNEKLKSALDRCSLTFLNELRNCDLEELMRYIDDRTGLGGIVGFLEQQNVLGETTSYCYVLYGIYCDDMKIEPVPLKRFTMTVMKLKGYKLKTVFVDGSTRNIFVK